MIFLLNISLLLRNTFLGPGSLGLGRLSSLLRRTGVLLGSCRWGVSAAGVGLDVLLLPSVEAVFDGFGGAFGEAFCLDVSVGCGEMRGWWFTDTGGSDAFGEFLA